MELRSDQIKRGVARAPHRSLLKADGITDEEMERGLQVLETVLTQLQKEKDA